MNFPAWTSNYSARQFGVFRIVFGAYLAWHFATLIPYVAELFGDRGVFGAGELNPFHGAWPNPFFLHGSGRFASAWMVAATAAAGLFVLGWGRRILSLFLWFTWSCLFTANPLIANPSLGYVGLLLLLCAVIPEGEAFVPRRPRDPNWTMPAMACVTAWALMAAGYTFSGVLKQSSPSWWDGSAMAHLMENPLARPGWARDILMALPDSVLKAMTWAVLALEVLFIPLCFFSLTRCWAWLAMLAIHAGIVLTVDFADLSLGMAMIHLFTFQRSWLPARRAVEGSDHVLFLDGDCAFCQRSARWLAGIDGREVLRFSSLQSETAGCLPAEWRRVSDEGSAAVLVEDRGSDRERRWRGDEAILRSLYLAGGPLALLWQLRRLPRRWRERTYRWVARRRHALGGRGGSCGLPSPSFARRFLP